VQAFLEAAKALPSVEDFWTRANRAKYPTLASYLPHILPLPATNTGMESGFSHATHVMAKRRHRLGDDMLSTLTMFSFDRWSLAGHFKKLSRMEGVVDITEPSDDGDDASSPAMAGAGGPGFVAPK
jgi:hypothetical protein